MPVESGKIEKLHLMPYSDPEYTEKAGPPFQALINPETYTYKYRIEFCENQAPGTSGVALKFNKMPPQEFNFDFLFDSTGIIQVDARPPLPVIDQLDMFRQNILEYQGDIHRPYYLKIHWGSLLFKGVLVSMDIEFKLFSPDGSPIRAIAKCAFKGSVEENLRLAKENRMSPDITHQRLMKGGDKLALMSKRIYKDQQYYIDVAGFNKMDGFRRPEPGKNIYFPPIE